MTVKEAAEALLEAIYHLKLDGGSDVVPDHEVMQLREALREDQSEHVHRALVELYSADSTRDALGIVHGSLLDACVIVYPDDWKVIDWEVIDD